MSTGEQGRAPPASGTEAFGKYRLTRRLAHGGMAEVFLATSHGEAGFTKPVVIKRLHPRLSEDAEFVNMLIDEARITSQLTHSNICQVLDLGSVDGSYYLAMEYIAGEELRVVQEHFMREGAPFPEPAALYVMSEVLAGLDYAHNQVSLDGEPLSIIHRDVSPQNVLVSYEGEVKVIDFGIAKARSRIVKTEAGVIKGKFRYMSPEQASGGQLDHRTDIFAAGVVFYELLLGRPHLMDVPDTEVLRRMREADLEPLDEHRADLSADLVALVHKALSLSPRRRYQTAAEFRQAIVLYQRARGHVFGRAELAELMRDRFSTKRRSGSPGGVRARAPRRPVEPTMALGGPGGPSDAALSGPVTPKSDSAAATHPAGPVYAVASGEIVADEGSGSEQRTGEPGFARAATVASSPDLAHDLGASGVRTVARGPGVGGTDPRSDAPTIARRRGGPPTGGQHAPPLSEVSTGQATREFSVPPEAPAREEEGGLAMLGQRVAGQPPAASPPPAPPVAPVPTVPDARPGEQPAVPEQRRLRESRGGRVGGTALRWSAREPDPRPRKEPGPRRQPPYAAALPVEQPSDRRRQETQVERRWGKPVVALVGILFTLAAMVGVLLAGAYAAKRLGLFDLFGSQAVVAPVDGAPLILDGPPRDVVDPSSGQVQVSSKPPGARISVCGTPTEQITPATVLLPEGKECVIELKRAGFTPYRSDPLTVNAGERLQIRAVLRRNPPRAAPRPVAQPAPRAATGRLAVTSLQLGEVFVNGRSMGRTPRLVLDLQPGTYDVFVRFTELGSASPARRVTVRAGERRTEHFRAPEQ